jgi:hypothetical protein
MQASELAGSVSLVDLKALATKHLRPASPLRNLILSEPDTIPASEAFVKIGIFSRLLQNEITAN